MIKKRNPVIAFLLSIFTPGLGHIYNGQLGKGITLFSLLLIFPLLFGKIGFSTLFVGFLILLLLEVGIRLYSIIDATILAFRQKNYALKTYNRWYYHLAIGTAMFVIFIGFPLRDILGIQTFRIPDKSMDPNLKIGDRAVANMKFEIESIDYGDIVVYKLPDEDVFYTCRVVGLPNDKVQLKDNLLIINGQVLKQTRIESKMIEGDETEVYLEQFPNDKTVAIYKLKSPFNPEITNTGELSIPTDSYYLVGDNRDYAIDSRLRGFIPKDRIYGKMIFTFWGQTTDRIGIDLTKR